MDRPQQAPWVVALLARASFHTRQTDNIQNQTVESPYATVSVGISKSSSSLYSRMRFSRRRSTSCEDEAERQDERARARRKPTYRVNSLLDKLPGLLRCTLGRASRRLLGLRRSALASLRLRGLADPARQRRLYERWPRQKNETQRKTYSASSS